MTIIKDLADNLKKADALNNKKRLKIVLAIFNTEVLKIGHSLTLSQLEKMLNIEKHDLAYHVLVLQDAGVISKKVFNEDGKKRTYYSTTKEGIKLLNILGVDENKVIELSSEMGLPIS